MADLLPIAFIVLAALALVLMLYFLWQSLRELSVHTADEGATRVHVSPERAALVAEKRTLLLALKDLEAERDAGKLSNEDFDELNARYRARARQVLLALDHELGPYREKARALLAQVTATGGETKTETGVNDPASRVDETTPAANTSRAATAATCSACGTVGDGDAVFCKKCGARLRAEPA